MAKPAFYIPLEEAIKSALVDLGESTPAMYQRCMSWAMRCMNELEWDVLKNLKRVILYVDATTKTALLPDDYVQHTIVGLRTANNEVVPLVHNPSLITNYTINTCNELCGNQHCDCGCNDEFCEEIGQSRVVTTTETVTIAGVDYEKTISVCTNEEGSVIQRTCEPVVSNPTQTCDYEITLPGENPAVLVPLNLPWTNFTFTKNGAEAFVGDVADKPTLQSVMSGNGFTEDGLTLLWDITATTDVWNSATWEDSLHNTQEALFTQSGCVNPTPTVETVCYEEEICDVEVKPCGCIVPSQTAIDVICNCCTFLTAVTQRQCKNKDFGQSLAQPKGYFGEFKIDEYAGTMTLNAEYQYDSVYLEYYSSSAQIDSKDWQIPAMAEEAIASYIKYKYRYNRNGVSLGEKMMLQKHWTNEKKKLKQRLNPIRMSELLEVMRVGQRP